MVINVGMRNDQGFGILRRGKQRFIDRSCGPRKPISTSTARMCILELQRKLTDLPFTTSESGAALHHPLKLLIYYTPIYCICGRQCSCDQMGWSYGPTGGSPWMQDWLKARNGRPRPTWGCCAKKGEEEEYARGNGVAAILQIRPLYCTTSFAFFCSVSIWICLNRTVCPSCEFSPEEGLSNQERSINDDSKHPMNHFRTPKYTHRPIGWLLRESPEDRWLLWWEGRRLLSMQIQF